MAYSKKKGPTAYYSTLHDSITSLYKTVLLSSNLKKHRFLVSKEQRLRELKSGNLKWQQDSLRHMIDLMGLQRDDILTESEVNAFRTHLLDTLLASPSPPHHDHALLIKDKLVFLQELLNAKCISEGEYHSSRRTLLVRLAVQGGGEVEGRDVIIAGSKDTKQDSEEEWSEIDLKDEQCLENSNSKKTSKQARKQVVKGATSVFGFGSSYKPGKNSMEKSIFDSPSLHTHSAQSKVPSSSVFTQSELRHSKENNNPFWDEPEKMKRKPFRALFHRDKNKKEDHGDGDHHGLEAAEKSAKKQWGFDGLRKWKKSGTDDDTVPLRTENEAYLPSYQLSSKAYDEVSVKNKLHSDTSLSDFSLDDKDLGDKKKELSGTPTEMRSTNTNLIFSGNQKQANSTKLPEYKAELKNDFPKPLDVVKKQFKYSVGEIENIYSDAEEKHGKSLGWTTFEDEENLHPNLFAHHDKSLRSSNINPFSQGYI